MTSRMIAISGLAAASACIMFRASIWKTLRQGVDHLLQKGVAARCAPSGKRMVKWGTWSGGISASKGRSVRSKTFQQLPLPKRDLAAAQPGSVPNVTTSVISRRNLQILEGLLESAHCGVGTCHVQHHPPPASQHLSLSVPTLTVTDCEPASDLDQVLAYLFDCESDANQSSGTLAAHNAVPAAQLDLSLSAPSSPATTIHSSSSSFTEELDAVLDEAMSLNTSSASNSTDDALINSLHNCAIDELTHTRTVSSGRDSLLLPPPLSDAFARSSASSLTLEERDALERGGAKVIIVRQSKSRWSAKEDALLAQCVRHYGFKWREICDKHFVDRNHEALRKRWKKIQSGHKSSDSLNV